MDERSELYPSLFDYPIDDKRYNQGVYMKAMLNRTLRMFEYDGLPDTIPQRQLELLLQCGGAATIGRVDDTDGGGVWAFRYGPGGGPNRYYLPRLSIVANPTLKKSYQFTVYSDDPAENDAVIIRNDSMYQGTLPITRRAAVMLADNDISMQLVDIMSRAQAIMSAGDDNTKRSAELFIKKIREGDLGVINADMDLIESLKVHPFAGQTGALTDLIEYHQYIKAGWFNDFGLSSNYNMKREAINSQEAQMGQDALLPLIDDMLRCREEGLKACNDMFGWRASVRLSDVWERAQELFDDDTTEEVPGDEMADDREDV